MAREMKRIWEFSTINLDFSCHKLHGTGPVRLVHTIVFDGDHAQDFIKGLGLAFAVPMREQVHNRHVRFIARLPVRGLNVLTRELRPQRIAQPRHPPDTRYRRGCRTACRYADDCAPKWHGPRNIPPVSYT